jgi:hypothetical protein
MKSMRFLDWYHHRRVILNLRLWRCHVQVWLWGARVIRSEDGRSFVALNEVFIWRL